MKKTLIAALLCSASVVGVSAGSAFAGEVTGKGKPTGMEGHARSECGFSGLEDEPQLTDGVAPGTPDGAIGHRRLTQTPHLVWATPEEIPGLPEPMWVNPPHGAPGTACRPGRP